MIDLFSCWLTSFICCISNAKRQKASEEEIAAEEREKFHVDGLKSPIFATANAGVTNAGSLELNVDRVCNC